MNNIDLRVNLAGLKLANPVLNASGTFGLNTQQLLGTFRPGALVTKSITLQPRPGNKPRRLVEVTSGLINAIGLEGCGVDDFIQHQLPQWLKLGVPIIASASGFTIDEYVELAQRLTAAGISAVELNLSCPNVKHGGMAFSTDASVTAQVVTAVRRETALPLIVKLTPNVTNIAQVAKAAVEAGADIIAAVNTFVALAVDIKTRRPKLGNVTGGMSGPAIKPLALAKVWQICQAVEVPVIGIGGISNADDAIEFLLAGARAIAVGTANFTDPTVMPKIVQGISQYLQEQGYNSVTEIIGTLRSN